MLRRLSLAMWYVLWSAVGLLASASGLAGMTLALVAGVVAFLVVGVAYAAGRLARILLQAGTP